MPLHSKIMTWKDFSHLKQIQAWKVLVQYFPKKATQYTVPVKVSSHSKSICCNWTSATCSFLGYGEIPSKISARKKTRSYLKMCLQSLTQATSRLHCLLTRTLAYAFNVRYLKGSTNQLGDSLSRLPPLQEKASYILLKFMKCLVGYEPQPVEFNSARGHCIRWWFVLTQTHCVS